MATRRRYCLLAALLGSLLSSNLTAQAPTSSTDGAIPPAIAPGNPASSYALSGIDHVNEYNGKLNMTIPLYRVGGRGTAGYTMMLPIEASWEVVRNYSTGSYYPGYDGTDGHAGSVWPYSPGELEARSVSGQPNACYDSNTGQWYDLGPYVTRIVWTAPDGTETVLLDTAYGGQPLDPPAGNGSDCPTFYDKQLANRGKVFRSAGGSDLTFIADRDVKIQTA